MLLESTITVIGIVGAFLIIMALFILRAYARKKRRDMLSNNKFIDLFFKDDEDLRREEYLPYANKPINRLHEPIFFAKSFMLFVDKNRVRQVYYKDIYWVYGIESRAKNRLRNSEFFKGDLLHIKTVKKTYEPFCNKQLPLVKFIASLNIPTGYSKMSKAEALKRKKYIKESKRKDNE